MKYRIAMWAGAGLLVAYCWAVYAFVNPINPAEPLVYTLARLTQPIVLAGSYFNVGLRVYWVLLANAATCGLIGLTVESLRRIPNHAE
jgi:hypothetical protein